jgi:hypothetical protein
MLHTPEPQTVFSAVAGIDEPVAIEIELKKDGPITLDFLTKLLSVGVVFLLTRHIATSVAIVSSLMAAFIPDAVKAAVARLRVGKKPVAAWSGVVTVFATLDSFLGKAVGQRVPGRASGTLKVRGQAGQPHPAVGHAFATSMAAATACTLAIAGAAVASGSSPFHAAPQAASGLQGTTFEAKAGSRAVVWFDYARERGGNDPQVYVKSSNGTTVASADLEDLDGNVLTTVPLPKTGRYSLVIDPQGAVIDQHHFIYLTPPDNTQALPASSTGVRRTVTLNAGQRATLSVNVPDNSQLELLLDPRSTIKRVDASDDGTQDLAPLTARTPFTTSTLSAGTHTVVLQPLGGESGTIAYTLRVRTG